MNVITLPATATTPLIEFRPGERELAIQGECFPENPVPFFEPVLATLRRYFTEQRPLAFDVRVRLQYVNSASTKAYRDANMKMHRDMDIPYSGDADADFVRGMIPHHQGAIDMARIVLAHGKDPEIRKLAENVVRDQEKEVAMMKDWLKKNGK